MRKAILGIVILIATATSAQTQPALMPAWSDTCELVRSALNLPHFYCPCKEGSQVFAFPLEREIKDTVWYTATLQDLRQGISAYWFANCTVTMEVFAFCTSKTPTFTLSVGANQMRDMSMEMINAKLAQLDEQAKLMAEQLTPHIRVYPAKGGSGRVYCYPYDQGPESKCEDPLPLRPGMTYVCDKEENVYRMEGSAIPSSGKAFILWKQKQNQPCDIWLTLDSCTGDEIGRAALSDSLHVFLPDSAQLVDARKAGRSLWLHVKHAKGITGRIFCYLNPKYADPLPEVSKSTCYGKAITEDARSYYDDTTFVDTLWITKDSLTTKAYSFTFSRPAMEYDTVYVTPMEIASGYIYKPAGVIFYEYTDSIVVEVKKAGACARLVQVAVLKKTTEGVDYVGKADKRSCKYLHNGQLFIIVDDRKFNVLGHELK